MKYIVIFSYFILTSCWSKPIIKKCGDTSATIKVTNKSTLDILQIQITSKDTISYFMDKGSLSIDKSRQLCFPCNGECSFVMKFYFENGDSVVLSDFYSEAGYYFKCNVFKDSVQMDHGLNIY